MTRLLKPGFCSICCATHFLCDPCDSGRAADTRALRIMAFGGVLAGAAARHRSMVQRRPTDDEDDNAAYLAEGYQYTGNGWR